MIFVSCGGISLPIMVTRVLSVTETSSLATTDCFVFISIFLPIVSVVVTVSTHSPTLAFL
jgi:hypothetical protein